MMKKWIMGWLKTMTPRSLKAGQLSMESAA